MEFDEILHGKPFTFNTWNVQGLSGKRREVFSEIERENEDLVVLTETKMRGTGKEEHEKYIHFYSGIKHGASRAGVSIFVKKNLGEVLKWEAVSERIITMKLRVFSKKVVVIGVYWVDEKATKVVKNRFQESLRHILNKVKKEHELIMLGDFNSKVGVSETSKVVGKFGDKEINDNGRRLIDLCNELSLKIQNTFFAHDDIHKYTWYHKRNLSKSLIDYIITKQNTSLIILDVIACRWLECESDHVFLEGTFFFLNPKNKNEKESMAEEDIHELRKYKTYMLYGESVRVSYKAYLELVINPSVERSTTAMYRHLKDSIHLAALSCLGTQDRDVFGEFFWDREIKKLRAKRLDSDSECVRISYPNRKKLDTYLDKLKNEVWEGICTTIEKTRTYERRNLAWDVLYDILNISNENAIQKQPSEEFYRCLFKKTRIDVKEFEGKKDDKKSKLYEINPQNTIQVRLTDITKALDELEDKWPAPGGLTVQLLKFSSTETKRLLTRLIQEIFNGNKIPLEINETYITEVMKVKNREKYEIKNGLHVHSIMRIMGVILKNLLQKNDNFENACKIMNQQTPLDSLFVLRLLFQKNAEKQNESFHVAFLDLKPLYFSIQHPKLFRELEKCGIHKALLGIIEHLYSLNTFRLVTHNKLSEKFTLCKGLISQCNLAPTLFKMYIRETMKLWSDENLQNGVKIGNRILSHIYSNDQLVIVANSHKSLEAMVLSLKHNFKKINLHVTLKKLKYLGNGKLTLGKYIIRGEDAIDFEGSILEIDGRSVEDAWKRILETKNAIGYLHPVVRDENISKKNKTRIFNLIIRCILSNGCETWTLTDELKITFNSREMNYWKWYCKDYPQRRAEVDLRDFVDVKNTISDSMMLKKAAWYTEIKQMSSDKWAKIIFNWDPSGVRKVGRPRKMWIDGIEEFVRDIGQSELYSQKNKSFINHDREEEKSEAAILKYR